MSGIGRIDLLRDTIKYAGRLWLYCLKGSVFLAIISVMVSCIKLAFSQSGDMPLSNMNDSNRSMIFPACPVDVACQDLPGHCIDCDFNETCVYGNMTEVTCMPKEGIQCIVSRQ